jgi:sRNA-binding protein
MELTQEDRYNALSHPAVLWTTRVQLAPCSNHEKTFVGTHAQDKIEESRERVRKGTRKREKRISAEKSAMSATATQNTKKKPAQLDHKIFVNS